MAKGYSALFCYFVCLQLVHCHFGLFNTALDDVSNVFHTIGDVIKPSPISLFNPTQIHPSNNRPVSVVESTDSRPSDNRPVSVVEPTDSRPSDNRPVSVVGPTDSRPSDNRPVSVVESTDSRPSQPVSIETHIINLPNASVEKSCTSVTGGTGTCMKLQACQPLVDISRNAASNPITTWILREAHCGFDGMEPMICCPIDDVNNVRTNLIEPQTLRPTTLQPTTLPPTTLRPTTLPPTTLPPTTLPSIGTTASKLSPVNMEYYDMLSIVGETCTTIYNTTGGCKDLYVCEPMMALLKIAMNNPVATEALRRSSCGFKNDIAQVCCPVPGQFEPTSLLPVSDLPSADSRTGRHFIRALPEPPVCGMSNGSSVRVAGGVPAQLGAFPWMALLGYNDTVSLKWRCGGSLISIRHVLTAAHCIHHQEDSLVFVRLGELDFSREDDGAAPIDIRIAEMIKHEEYTMNKAVLNDIGLLVLENDVQFTDMIKPICLFLDKDPRFNSFEGFNPFVAGWGVTTFRGPKATHMQVAGVPVLGDEACEEAYGMFAGNSLTQFLQGAMCAGFPNGKIDSCSGDSGGPLMLPMQNNVSTTFFFYEIGVVSFGESCAQAGKPGVYSRISYFMPWIEEKVLGRTRT